MKRLNHRSTCAPWFRRALGALTAAMALQLGTVPMAGAQEFSQDDLANLLRVKVRTVQHMALNPVVIKAARAQNASGLSLQEIKRRDDEWKASKELNDFKMELQTNQAGSFLKRQVERSTSFNEAFLTDNQGANVAAFPATSDYWQGDEEKWTASYKKGGNSGELFIGPIEEDESTQTLAVQISAPVIDRGRTIGVLVVGVTFTYLEARRQ